MSQKILGRVSGGTSTTWNDTVPIANLPIGTANQVLVTNAGGTAATYTSTIAPARIAGGTDAQTLIMLGSTPTWTSTSNYWLYASIPFSVQDWNSGATTSLTFGDMTEVDYTRGTPIWETITTTGSAPYSGFTVNYTNNSIYKFDFSVVLDNAAIGTSQVSVRLTSNGTPVGPSLYSTILPIGITGKNTITGTIIRQIAAGTKIGFQASRVQGTGAMTSNSASSYVHVTLVDNVR